MGGAESGRASAGRGARAEALSRQGSGRPHEDRPLRVDSHHHFWRVARGDYGWLTPETGPIFRDYGPSDLEPILQRHGIGRTILVQAAPTLAETRFLLDTAARTPFVAGVVGWADFAGSDAPRLIAETAADPLLVGLRPMVQDIGDDDWLVRPELAPAFHALLAASLVFDALVLPRHLPRLLSVADRYPGLTIVIDHGAKPHIRQGRLDPWADDMAALARRPNVVCKLSGLANEAGPGWTVAQLEHYVRHLVDVFGPDRLLWGSDWPVVELAGSYDAWMDASEQLLAPLSPAMRAAVFGGNAARIYLAKRGRAC